MESSVIRDIKSLDHNNHHANISKYTVKIKIYTTYIHRTYHNKIKSIQITEKISKTFVAHDCLKEKYLFLKKLQVSKNGENNR